MISAWINACLGIIGVAAEADATLLIVVMFRMHEGQIEKAPLRNCESAVEFTRNRARGNPTRERIGGERVRRAAEHVARKLVEHEDEGERVFRRLLPCGQAAGYGPPVGRQIPMAYECIEFRIAREPFVGAERAPER
mgnify:CR=1 FL=1